MHYFFNLSYKIDNLSTFMKILTIGSGIFVMLTSSKYLQLTKIFKIRLNHTQKSFEDGCAFQSIEKKVK